MEKNFVKHKLRPRSMAIAVLGRLANPTRPEAYLDALTPSEARFLRRESSRPLASPTLWRHLYR
jgi:hypothetical protein